MNKGEPVMERLLDQDHDPDWGCLTLSNSSESVEKLVGENMNVAAGL